MSFPDQIVLSSDGVHPLRFASLENQLIAMNLKDGSSVFKHVGTPIPGTGKRLWQFGSIGGLDSSLVVLLDEKNGLPIFASARLLVGVLYYD